MTDFKINRKYFQGPYQKGVSIRHLHEPKEQGFTVLQDGKEETVSANLS